MSIHLFDIHKTALRLCEKQPTICSAQINTQQYKGLFVCKQAGISRKQCPLLAHNRPSAYAKYKSLLRVTQVSFLRFMATFMSVARKTLHSIQFPQT